MYAPDIEKHINDATFWRNLSKVKQTEINQLREGLRDKFAMATMNGLISSLGRDYNVIEYSVVAAMAYEQADAMLEERIKKES